MSSRKAESRLPSELNENWGSNYGMDGFMHDMDYGNGLEESIGADPVPQPSTSGFAHLPDGVLIGTGDNEMSWEDEIEISDEEGGLDLEALQIVAAFDPTTDISTTGVVDHSWMADAFQDPSRLPDNPVDDMIPELQDAWGDRTNGIQRIDLYEREATQPNLGERREDDDTLNQEKLASIVRSAMRRSASGKDFAQIMGEVKAILGEDAPRIAKPLRAIEAEHGLVGNVYVRASAYPGLHQGKWSKSLRNASRTAQFLVASAGEDCRGCAEALGLRVISHPDKIDWESTYARYAKNLQMTGRLRHSASAGFDKKETLRRAFLHAEQAPQFRVETANVRHMMPADTVTTEAAREAWASAPFAQQEQFEDQRVAKQEQAKFTQRLGSLVKARLLSKEEAVSLLKSKAPVQARLKMAELLAARSKRASYSGAVRRDPNVTMSAAEFASIKSDAQNSHAKTASASEEMERRVVLQQFFQLEEVRQAALQKVGGIRQRIASGTKGPALHRLVDKTFTSRERVLVASVLDTVLMQAGFFDQGPQDGRTYEGPLHHANMPETHVSGVSDREIRTALRWTRRQMSEGAAGDQLDHLLHHRFSKPVLKAANAKLVQLRSKHEGLAGHLYVEAAAYASAEGTTGCEKGGLRHRADGVRYVLAMPRCEECVFKNANSVCQKYNKPLIDLIPPDVAADLQRQVLASHRQSDAEDTASLFHTPDLVSEYGLHNASLDDIETEEPVFESLEGIFFGGFEV